MEFVIAKANPEKGTARLVFRVSKDTFAVVKRFKTEKPHTVKVWKLGDSDLETTMSYWNTTERFSPPPHEIEDAKSKALELCAVVVDTSSRSE